MTQDSVIHRHSAVPSLRRRSINSRRRDCVTIDFTSRRFVLPRARPCSLLSGRNHHAVGFGSISELIGSWPGYSTNWPTSAASIAQILRANGYNTAAIGKWHLTPDSQQGPAGPFDRWPNALGFDYFRGVLGGEDSQFDPLLAENNNIIGVPRDKNF